MYIAILLTRYFQQESDFDEWVQHHLSLGFSHVHVFDNGTAFNLEAACKKYGNSVSYEKVEGHVCQYVLYEKYIKGCNAEYVMPIDDDEYLWLAPEFTTIVDLLEHYGNPDCFGIRWKYMFPKRYNRVRNVPVLKYCTENDTTASRFFFGDNTIKCIVKCSEFVRYMDSGESMRRNHIPVTKTDAGALLWDGRRTTSQTVRDLKDEPVRLLHCPYKGHDEFLNTRGRDRHGVSRRQDVIRKGKLHFLKWLEKDYERQTA